MRKASTISAFMFVAAVIILMIAVIAFTGFVYGNQYIKPNVSQSNSSGNQGSLAPNCASNQDCNNNANGSACVNIADPHFPERNFYFCGCYLNSQCASTAQVARSGVCGEKNTC